MNRLDKARLLKAVYDGQGTAFDALERLSRSSSSVASSVTICRQACPDLKAREMVARAFLNCYSAGLLAGIEATNAEGATR